MFRLWPWLLCIGLGVAVAHLVRVLPSPTPPSAKPVTLIPIATNGTLPVDNPACLAFLDQWLDYPGWSLRIAKRVYMCSLSNSETGALVVHADGGAVRESDNILLPGEWLDAEQRASLRELAVLSCEPRNPSGTPSVSYTVQWGDRRDAPGIWVLEDSDAGDHLRGLISP